MLRLVSILLVLIVTAALFCDLTCFAAVVQRHKNPGNKSRALERVPRHSISVRQPRPTLAECAAPGWAWYGCVFSTEIYCSIHKKTGELNGCHDASRCGAVAIGYEMVCDPTSDYCCCKGDLSGLACNDIRSQKSDKVWLQACKLPDLIGHYYCRTSQTTPKPVYSCVTQEPNGMRTEKQCTDPDKHFCGIDKQSGGAVDCVSDSDCPPGIYGYSRGTVLCKNENGVKGRYCCCPDDEGKPTRCNDIFNERDNTAWREVCRQDELKTLWVFQRSWTTTPRPPPTPPPHPPPPFITAENMSRHCLDYCIENAPPGNPGPFELRCGNPVPGQPTWNCPPPCPLGCDRYCEDGTNLKCHKLPQPTSKPVGPPGNGTTSTSASVLEPPREPPFLDEEDKEELPLAVIIGVVAVVTILAVAGVWFWLKKRPPVHPHSAPTMNTSAYSGPGGQANSATSISSSPSGNLSSSSSLQMAPQAQLKGGYSQPR